MTEHDARPASSTDLPADLAGAPTVGLTRREALSVLGALPIAAVLGQPTLASRAWDHVAAQDGNRSTGGAPTPYAPKFFTGHEWRTVRMLADYVIPRDERSGSASDARVPEFMDFIVGDQPDLQTPMRGGLQWLDAYCRHQFSAAFADCSTEQRTRVLDDIAWPSRAQPAVSQGVAFFSRFRDLVASGFWTSAIGIADLQYMGNTVVAEWRGCPDAVLSKLGVHDS